MTPAEMIDALVARSRKAQEQIAELSQAEVDRMVKGVGFRAYNEAEKCGTMAYEETQKGNIPTKISKQARSVMWIWHYLKNSPSVGVVEDLPELGLVKIAKPVGVVANVTPVTNPTATPCGNALYVLKARNSMIVGPHPGAKKSTTYAVECMRDELKKMGFPEDLLLVVDDPTIEKSNLLMKACDIVIATGGPGMVKAAYSSGRPSFGVGQGNAQTLVDPDYDDYDYLCNQLINNRTYDNGMPCTTDQTVHIHLSKVDKLIATLKEKGGYMVTDPKQIQQLRDACFPEGMINRDIVGQPAATLAKIAGIDIPADTLVLYCMVDKWGTDDVLAKEIMAPFTRILPYDKFEEAVERARINYFMEGAGHSGSIYSNNEKNIALAGDRIPVGRLCVNQNPSFGGGCNSTNGLWPTNSLGCGFWGNNNIGDNLTYKHIMNYTFVARAVAGIPTPTPEEIWAD